MHIEVGKWDKWLVDERQEIWAVTWKLDHGLQNILIRESFTPS